MACRGVFSASHDALEINELALKHWETAREGPRWSASCNRWEDLTPVGPCLGVTVAGWNPGVAAPWERAPFSPPALPLSPGPGPPPSVGNLLGAPIAFESEPSVLRNTLSLVFGLIS